MTSRAGIILQARLGSTRLPRKVLASTGGMFLYRDYPPVTGIVPAVTGTVPALAGTVPSPSVIERCLNRLSMAGVGPVILATTESAEDDALVAVARQMRAPVHRGRTDDVLHRVLEAALTFGLEVVIRATGDNPAVDIGAPARVLAALRAASADYACEDGLPYGAGVEAVAVSALGRTAALATSQSDREHVTSYLKHRPGTFRVVRQLAPPALQRPDIRVTVDVQEDLDHVRRLFASARSIEPTLSELIAVSDLVTRNEAAA